MRSQERWLSSQKQSVPLKIADEKHFNELKNAITDAIAKAANDVNALRNWTEAELNKKSNKIF